MGPPLLMQLSGNLKELDEWFQVLKNGLNLIVDPIRNLKAMVNNQGFLKKGIIFPLYGLTQDLSKHMIDIMQN